jgi:hypothetical protein
VHVHAKDIPKRRGFSPHYHSGKLTAHHHTSYASLAFLLLLGGVVATAATVSAHAASESALLSLTVQGAPPGTPATIDDPINGQRFTVPSTTVRGTCPTGVFVEIWRNGAFAGSTICDLTGLYTVVITLTPGQNDLVARVSDALGQYGPDSATVTVYYDVPPPTPTPTPTAAPTATPRPSPQPAPAPGAAPLVITSDKHYYEASAPGISVEWLVTVTGGAPPYQLTWDWGDGTHDTLSAASPGSVAMHHAYDTAGTYEVTVRAKDARGAEAVLQVVTIVNGPAGAASIIRSRPDPGVLLFIWPMLVLAVLLTASFWLGERHKLAMLRPRLRPVLAP